MIAAIYARKSTDQNLPDAEKRAARQIEHATAYATRKGWTVDPAYAYQDDGISGAGFPNEQGHGLILMHPQQARQGLKKLLAGRLAFTPTADGTAVEFTGQGRLDPILAGVIEANGLPKVGVSPRDAARTWTFRLTGRVTARRIA